MQPREKQRENDSRHRLCFPIFVSLSLPLYIFLFVSLPLFLCLSKWRGRVFQRASATCPAIVSSLFLSSIVSASLSAIPREFLVFVLSDSSAFLAGGCTGIMPASGNFAGFFGFPFWSRGECVSLAHRVDSIATFDRVATRRFLTRRVAICRHVFQTANCFRFRLLGIVTRIYNSIKYTNRYKRLQNVAYHPCHVRDFELLKIQTTIAPKYFSNATKC